MPRLYGSAPPRLAPNWLYSSVGFAAKKTPRIQLVIAQEFIDRSMQLIGAGSGRHLQVAAARAPQFRLVVADSTFISSSDSTGRVLAERCDTEENVLCAAASR